MKFFVTLLVLPLLISCSTSTSKDEASAQLYINLGASQLNQGHPHLALKSLLNAKKLDPENAQVYQQLGLAYFALKKYKLAVNNFLNALSLDSQMTDARVNLGRALIETGEYDDAREQFRLALADLTYSNTSLVYFNLGLSHFRQRHYQKAISFFQKSIAIEKRNCLAYTYYGRSLYELKDFASANRTFELALPLCKPLNFDEAHFFAALSYFKSGNKSRGIALMNETILHYPDGPHNEKAQQMLELMKLNRL